MSQRTHNLKTWPLQFAAVVRGDKPYELRKNDRRFKVGDVLCLKEYDPDLAPNAVRGAFTGATHWVAITYITLGGEWGLPDDLCILGITPTGQRAQVATKHCNHCRGANWLCDLHGKNCLDHGQRRIHCAMPRSRCPDCAGAGGR